MSEQQGNEALVPELVSGIEEEKQVLPGALLAAQRQAKGWSVEHAASQLKFATRQVLALEADNYTALPGAVVVRGFVRAYAKLLGLDANALVALLPQERPVLGERIPPQRTLSAPFSESPLPLGNRRKISPAILIGGAVVIVLVAAGVVLHKTDLLGKLPQMAWLKHDSQASATSDEAAAPASAEQAEVVPEVQESPDAVKTESDAPRADAAANANVPAAVAAAPERPAEAAAPVAPLPAATPAPAPAPAPVPAAPSAAESKVSAAKPGTAASPVTGNLNISQSKNLLRLTFREDSWVEIRRGDNSTMISRLLKAGTTEAFDIAEPVTLVVGNAAGVDASLRGTKLDLQTNNSSNVARLSLK